VNVNDAIITLSAPQLC